MNRIYLGLALAFSSGCAANADEPPVELGRIAFQRDFGQAVAKAKAGAKPLFVLFDEVPGCQTCRDFGTGPLSHPIAVAAAEAEFVPVAVANNVPGPDAAVLKRFREPAWNNPVVRFLDAAENDLIPRKDGEYTVGFLLPRMAKALEAAKRPVPQYLKLAAAEAAPQKPETAAFAMYCYWEGEAKLGALDGVVGTRIGELRGAETVEVTFDAAVLDYGSLVKKALELDCAHRVFARTDDQLKTAKALAGNRAVRTDDALDTRTQQQYHLAHYPQYHALPLTAAQATRANALIAAGRWPDEVLSPKQLELKARFAKLKPDEQKALKLPAPDRSAGGLVKYSRAVEKAFPAR